MLCLVEGGSKTYTTGYVFGAAAQSALLATSQYKRLQLHVAGDVQHAGLFWPIDFTPIERHHIDP